MATLAAAPIRVESGELVVRLSSLSEPEFVAEEDAVRPPVELVADGDAVRLAPSEGGELVEEGPAGRFPPSDGAEFVAEESPARLSPVEGAELVAGDATVRLASLENGLNSPRPEKAWTAKK